MRPCAARSPGLTRTSYSVLGARTMHVMLDRREVAERRGAGHVARCTACTAHGRLGPAMVSGAPNRRTLRARLLEDQCPADLVRRHFEAFAPGGLWVADIPPLRGRYPLLRAHHERPGARGLRPPTSTPGGSSAGRPPTGQCAPTWPWTPWRWPSGSGNVRGADLSGLVHHLRPRRAVQVHPPRGCPVRVRGDHLGGVDGRLLLALPWPRL